MDRLLLVLATCGIGASCAREPATPVRQPAPLAAASRSAEPSDVIFAVDMSKSMLEGDVPPTRLEATKLALRRFVANDRIDHIGIVIFSQQSKRLAPLDSRTDDLEQVIASLRMGDVPELGTGIGDGLAAAVDAVRAGSAKRQTVVLISDGDYNWATHFDPEQAITAAKSVGVTVHTILIGNDPAGGVPTTNPPLMEHIAAATGGTFSRAPDAAALDRALNDTLAKLRAER